MIEARELRIGNATSEGTVFEIKDKSARVRNHNRSSLVSYEDLFPIPLTEEILLKCGFDQNEYCFFIPKISNIYFKKPFIEADYFLVKSIGGDKLTTAKHLHQLQNLYFALTGEELNVQL